MSGRPGLSGSALMALASAGEALSAFLVSVLVATRGGPEALGRFATATALLLVGVTLSEMGQNVVLTRRTASRDSRARRGLGASLLVKGAAGILLAPLVVRLWPAGEPRYGMLAALALLVLSSWAISLTAVLRGHERFGRVAIASALAASVAIAGVGLLRPTGLAAILAVLAVAQALKLAVALGSLPPGLHPACPLAGDVRDLVAETLPFAAIVLVGAAYLKADILVVSAIAGAAEAGRYAAAVRLTEALKLVPTALGLALFPALAAGDERGLPRALGGAALFGVLVVAFAAAAGEPALAGLFGAPFAASAAPLRVLSLTFLVGSLNALLILALYARHEERAALGALAAALGVNLLANLALVPRSGAVGAALASLASEVVLVALYARALARGKAEVPASRAFAAEVRT